MEFRDTKIAGKYVVGPKIGSGSFGQVYLVNVFGTTEIYALKKQDERAKHLQLIAEARILKTFEGVTGYAQIYWQGNQTKCNLMITDLLGPSLQDLYLMCGKKFSLKTTLMLADQFLQRIEMLHSKNYIHRDIKPQNFLVGLAKKSHIIHLIDFGLSKKYRDPKTHQHIPYKENKNLTGTARYASINAHLGIEQSRRDDLEAIGYVLLYFVQGFLPWQGIRANNKLQKYQKIMQKKMAIPVQIQCRGLPIQFSMYLNYCRSLKFEDKPDYTFLRRLFRQLMQRQGFKMDFDYDWCNLDEERELENCKVKIEIKKPPNANDISQVDEQEEQKQVISHDLIGIVQDKSQVADKSINQPMDKSLHQPMDNSVNKPIDKSVNKSMNKSLANKSNNISQSKYKANNNSNVLDASDLSVQIKSGQENIDDDEIVDEQFDIQAKNQNKKEIDLEEKKNKMLYDDDDD